MKKQLLIIPAVFFLFILLSFFYLLIIERNPSEIPSNLVNKNVPSFEKETLLKKVKFSSPKEFTNQIVLVNFFATWCLPCRNEHEFIKRFSNEKKIKVVGINYKDNAEKTVQWLENLGNPYSAILEDKNGELAIDWGVYGIPETFIVSSDGIIKYRYAGPINKKIYKKINSLIKEIK